MQIISVWHPDVELFVDIKNDKFAEYVQEFAKYDHETSKKLSIEYSDRRKVSYSNISVLLNSEFMDAVISNETFDLIFPDYEISGREVYNDKWDGDIYKWKAEGLPVKVYRTINARELWNKIIHAAWRSAEPGIIFEDEIRKNWTIDSPFHGVNPCITGDTKIAVADGRNYATIKELAETLVKTFKPYTGASLTIASLYALVKEKEPALEWLEKACQEHAPFLVHLKAHPLLFK